MVCPCGGGVKNRDLWWPEEALEAVGRSCYCCCLIVVVSLELEKEGWAIAGTVRAEDGD